MTRLLELWFLIESCLSAATVAKSFIDKRASNACPSDDYTSENGLTFSTSNLCLQNLAGNDLSHVESITSIQDCMDLCASAPGDIACSGISYNFKVETCWLKNLNVSISGASSESNTHSAVATNFGYDASNIACPYTNGSEQTTANGMRLQILCDNDMALNDYCPSDGPRPVRADGVCPYHTDTMDECLDLCSKASPTCSGVIFNPDRGMGYGNCYLKSAISNANIVSLSEVAPARHLALVNNIPSLDESCDNNTISKASNGDQFLLTCNDNRSGNDLIRVHSENLTACIDACTSFSNATAGNCAGVMWDSTMRSSWENCWLKSDAGVPSTVAGGFTAMKTTSNGGGGSGNSTEPSPTPAPSSGGGSSSKAWIAGVVIGILAVVALVAFAVWFLRRRRARQPEATLSELPSEAKTVYAKEAPPNGHVYHELGDRKEGALASQTAPQMPPQELAGGFHSDQVHELPSNPK